MTHKFTIDKEFSFEAGHRVWAQKLNHQHLSISTECSCQHLHGHSYTIKVFLGADQLDQSSMVTDFKNLNFMKQFVDNVLDHKFIIDINDPLFPMITTADRPKEVKDFTNLASYLKEPPGNAFLESFVLVNFVPTSENLCKHIMEYAQTMIGEVATVVAVELWETKKSHCRYQA